MSGILKELNKAEETIAIMERQLQQMADQVEQLTKDDEDSRREVAACHAIFAHVLRLCGHDPDAGHPMLIDAVAGVTQERDALLAFKKFVHDYLSEHGVPEGDPTNRHQQEGCRIGARLDLLFSQRDQLRQTVADIVARDPVIRDRCADALLRNDGQTAEELIAELKADGAGATVELAGPAQEMIDAAAMLDAWKGDSIFRRSEVRSFVHGGWQVSLYQTGCHPVEAFGDRHRTMSPHGPFRSEVYCRHDDGTPATLAETIAAALRKWDETNPATPEGA